MRRYFFSRQGATKEDTETKYLIEEQRSIEKKDQVKILKPFMIQNISDPRERYLAVPSNHTPCTLGNNAGFRK
jgi:hypothetical protein